MGKLLENENLKNFFDTKGNHQFKILRVQTEYTVIYLCKIEGIDYTISGKIMGGSILDYFESPNNLLRNLEDVKVYENTYYRDYQHSKNNN